jgi:hypothetical protein
MPETETNPTAHRDDAYDPTPLVRDEHTEPTFTRVIEQQTARIPSHWFLLAAFTAMAASLVFEVTGRSRWSRFVGMWAPSLLITGVYNKLVKSFGPR